MDSTRTPSEAGPGSEVCGTYRHKPNWVAAWASAALLGSVGTLAVLLALLGQTSWIDATLAASSGVGMAVAIWALFARPRLVVQASGVTVVDPVHITRMRWDEIDHFDCGRGLVVCQTDGSVTSVTALPAAGLRRYLLGRPGRVDLLAVRLNEHLADITGDGRGRKPLSIETAEGRRELRAFAVVATAAVVIVGVFRIVLAPHL